jgi:hypothetical protein
LIFFVVTLNSDIDENDPTRSFNPAAITTNKDVTPEMALRARAREESENETIDVDGVIETMNSPKEVIRERQAEMSRRLYLMAKIAALCFLVTSKKKEGNGEAEAS